MEGVVVMAREEGKVEIIRNSAGFIEKTMIPEKAVELIKAQARQQTLAEVEEMVTERIESIKERHTDCETPHCHNVLGFALSDLLSELTKLK